MQFEGTQLSGNVIGGREVPAASGARRMKVAPATGQNIFHVADSSAQDVEDAVAAATVAQREWRALSVADRRTALLAWAAKLREAFEDIAYLDAIDSGSPLGDGRKGLLRGIEHLEHFAGLGFELTGQTVPATAGNLHYTIREPFGVVGILTPFNHPSFFPIKLSAPALAAGNAVIIKPSEQTPLSASIIGTTAIGVLPDGLVNVVQGGPEVGKALVGHPKIDRLHLTGGVPTGLAIQQAAAQSGKVKHVTLELGGKNPLIVFPDVSPESAASAAVKGMNFTHQGQSCGSTSRLFVHKSIAAEVIDLIAKKVENIKVGLPDDPSSEMGSMVSEKHQQRVLSMIEMAKDDGATLLTGGTTGDGELAAGAYVMPTVFTGVNANMRIAQQEVFGPVLSVIEWDDENDMIEAANSTEYGLTAAIWTNDLQKALNTAARIESGFVWVNGVVSRYLGMPFGGYKNSGTGLEHARETMLSYTHEKSINVLLSRGTV
jgi:acyl-CoA reductase-like NAD-dependent aldehyde dehydrogenase